MLVGEQLDDPRSQRVGKHPQQIISGH